MQTIKTLSFKLFFSIGFLAMAQTALAREKAPLLEREVAEDRAKRVSEVTYELFIELKAASETFSGKVDVSFELTNPSGGMTLDFIEGQVESLVINDKEEKKIDYNGFFLTLPAKTLKKGTNKVTIGFTHPYSKTGSGFYRFVDPEDQRVYTYTDFEPYDANLLFPCFDQPNIKARYTLSVSAPAKWVVISSTMEKQVKAGADGQKLWSFPQTQSFSTYVFSLHAGEYHSWKSNAGKVPLRIFARQSIKQYITYQEWFEITRQSMAFFDKYFGYPYPFGKYDQIVVPDFNSGAMENVAAVTFSERYFPRSKPTIPERERFAETVIHELAHMWFGNLVTMNWWNDLWLNESFATYLATVAMVNATRFKNNWENFYRGEKLWGYWEDQLVTTHPITTEVNATDQAFTNFDGITYGKGAGVLKQLDFLLGENKFRDGVRNYIKKHAYGNTTLDQFMGSLSEVAKVDLTGFKQEWLEKKGLNTAEAVYECANDKVSSFAIRQTAPSNAPTLRTHRTQVALYGSKKNHLAAYKILPVTYAESLTDIKDLVGQPCPQMVLLNNGDNDFVKMKLDRKTLQAAKTSLSTLEDPLDRMMVWQSLWDMVREGELDVYSYSNLVYDNITKEKHQKIIDGLLATIVGKQTGGLTTYLPDKGAQEAKRLDEFYRNWEALMWSQVKKAAPGSDLQKTWYDGYVALGRSKEALERFASILAGKTKVNGLKVDQDRRWSLLFKLSAFDFPGVSDLLAKESKQDPSDKGKRAALSVKAAYPDYENKKTWFDTLIAKNDLSLAHQRAIMVGMFPKNQMQLRAKFDDLFFNTVPSIAGKRNENFLKTFVQLLAPALCNQASANKLEKFIAKNRNLPPYMLKPLLVENQEDQRCTSIHKVASASLKE